MNVLVYLVPLALCLGGIGLAAFLWALRTGQFDDLDGAAWRAIGDDDIPEDGRWGQNHSTRSASTTSGAMTAQSAATQEPSYWHIRPGG
jgi:cbb3-type cytochrome oxidase maturation protein